MQAGDSEPRIIHLDPVVGQTREEINLITEDFESGADGWVPRCWMAID